MTFAVFHQPVVTIYDSKEMTKITEAGIQSTISDEGLYGMVCRVLEEEQPTTDEAGNTVPVAVTAEKRLNAALVILQYLEQNGIIGEAAFVDVTDLGDIHMQYGSRYQIELGNDTELFEKIKCLKGAVTQVSKDYPYSTGTIDLSDLKKILFPKC